MQLPSQRARARLAPMAEINVTPLVDVMLVLLIIFMVTAPLLVTGVPVELPETRAKALDQAEEPVQISLDREGRVFVDDREVGDGLAEALAGVNKERAVFLRADTGLDYGRVMRVMGELNRAGLNKVSLVTTGGDGDG